MKDLARLVQKSSSRGWLLLNAKELIQRFGVLDAVTKKMHIFQDEKPEAPTDGEILEGALQQLALQPEVSSALIPMLEGHLEEIEEAIPGAIKSHAELCVLEGKKFQVQLYLKMFKQFIEGE